MERGVPLAKGEPENPVTWDEGIAKFASLAEGTLGQERARRVVNAVRGLEDTQDFSEFAALLRP